MLPATAFYATMLASSWKKCSWILFSHVAPPPKAFTLLLHSPKERSEHKIKFLLRCKAVLLTLHFIPWSDSSLCSAFSTGCGDDLEGIFGHSLSWSLAKVFQPTQNALFIDHSFYWFMFVCTICLGYLLACWQIGSKSYWVLFILLLQKTISISGSISLLLLVSIKLVRVTSWAEDVGGEAHTTAVFESKMFWPWRLPSPKPKPLFDVKP